MNGEDNHQDPFQDSGSDWEEDNLEVQDSDGSDFDNSDADANVLMRRRPRREVTSSVRSLTPPPPARRIPIGYVVGVLFWIRSTSSTPNYRTALNALAAATAEELPNKFRSNKRPLPPG
ncbi:hypothetical protein QE152_g10929 [Popillia japonica]|uniref:Uncharacterized protein n=1 Tax=Popillia japonica TaxID=7064 RepID=A0AAW1LUT9_POPJA